jgi:hypothetical protein
MVSRPLIAFVATLGEGQRDSVRDARQDRDIASDPVARQPERNASAAAQDADTGELPT